MTVYKTLKEWNSEKRFASKIFIVDKLRYGNAALHRLNLGEKEYSVNLRYRTLRQLAEEIVGWNLAETELDQKPYCIDWDVSVSMLEEILKDGQFRFFQNQWADVPTCTEIFRCMELLRRNQLKEAFYADNIPERIRDLRQMLDVYEQMLQDSGMYDTTRLLWEALHFLEEDRSVLTVLGYENTEFAVSADMRMDALEREFYSVLRGDTEEEEIVIQAYALPEAERKELPVDYYTTAPEAYITDLPEAEWRFCKGYGIYNEARNAAEQIIASGERFGENVLYYTAEVYENYIQSVFGRLQIPVQFADGEKMSTDNAAGLFLRLAKWAEYRFEEKYLQAVFYNPVLTLPESDSEEKISARKQYRQMLRDGGIGWGRERYASFLARERKVLQEGGSGQEEGSVRYTEGFLACLEAVLHLFDVEEGTVREEEFLLRLVTFAENYVRKGLARNTLIMHWKNRMQIDGKRNIRLEEGELSRWLSEDLEDLRGGVSEPRPDHVIACRISGRDLPDRKNLYVMGLSEKHFAEKVQESPVLSDEELKTYAEGILPGKLQREEIRKWGLAATLAAAGNSRITLSYPYYDTVEMYENTPSLFYLELQEMTGTINQNEQVYPDYAKEARSCAGQGEILAEQIEKEQRAVPCENVYSATSLQELLQCPKKYYLHHILGISKPQYREYDPDQWLKANEKGTLIHKILEVYVQRFFIEEQNYEFQKAEFDCIVRKCAEEVLESMKPYPSKAVYESQVGEIQSALEQYLDSLCKEFTEDKESGWHIFSVETECRTDGSFEEINAVLKLTGRVDRVDYREENGRRIYRIIDYKSGKQPKKSDEMKIKQLEIQASVYMMMLEGMMKAGEIPEGEVEKTVFEFLMKNQEPYEVAKDIVCCTREQIKEVFLLIERENRYPELPCPEGEKETAFREERCKYCDYAEFCRGVK